MEFRSPFGNYGYSTNYNSLKTLVEPLVKNGIASDFNEYCLSLKMEQSWRSRTEMLKGSYREYIANRLNRSLIDLPQEAESLLNLFDSEGLYSTSEGVIMFMDRLKELIGA